MLHAGHLSTSKTYQKNKKIEIVHQSHPRISKKQQSSTWIEKWIEMALHHVPLRSYKCCIQLCCIHGWFHPIKPNCKFHTLRGASDSMYILLSHRLNRFGSCVGVGAEACSSLITKRPYLKHKRTWKHVKANMRTLLKNNPGDIGSFSYPQNNLKNIETPKKYSNII